MFLELTGKTAIVTGAAQSIGYAIAQRFGVAGANIVIADIDGDKAQQAAAALNGEGRTALAIQVDITKADQVEQLVDRTIEVYGQLDILVNNAGITGGSMPLWEQTEENWQRVLDVNLTGVFLTCRAVIGHMRERRSGSIVNIASVAGKEGNPNLLPYSVSKAGVICLTKALAKEVATEGIRVNSVAPAVIETAMLAQVTPEMVAYMASKIPMNRVGKPEEVAAVVHFLASDAASFVTGQCYDISGGRCTY
jgi:3-oxoacyl-[acyl-carrier protein] reductase